MTMAAFNTGQQQQQQPQQQAPAPGGGVSLAPAGLQGYDMSSLDQLQAHALQLSASAGLTNLLMPNNQIQQQQNNSNGNNGQQQMGQQNKQQQQQGQQFLFLQPNQGLPANGQNFQAVTGEAITQFFNSNNNSNNNTNGGQFQARNFFLGAQGGNTAQAPANLGQQLFVTAQGGAPMSFNLGALQGQQNSYSATGIPIPVPMLFQGQQQNQQQQQQQQQNPQKQQYLPLQPAPPTTGDKGGGKQNDLTGNKRNASVISSSTISSDSNASGAPNPAQATSSAQFMANEAGDDTEYPDFQLRNKDGSIITEADLEKMTPNERRRYERNLREQQRSFRISQQIQQLRDVLAESKVPFKPNKYSILVSVADYIKQLQTRAVMLDSEHKKLFKTIQETNEMVSSGQIPDCGACSADPGKGDSAGNLSAMGGQNQGDVDMVFVQGLDYKAVFDQAPTANGVASIDGRILACNKEMETLLECSRDQIERQSLFTLVQNHQEIFEAMAELLKRADALSNGSLKADPVQVLYWSGNITTPQDKNLGMNITLACTSGGSPQFFSFCICPVMPEE